jgi:tRNA U38,U39,U40 pseudouridine synthase TruA
MVGLLLEIGLGKTDIDAVRSALADPGSAQKGPAAPAKGLCLRRVVIGRGTRARTNGEREER